MANFELKPVICVLDELAAHSKDIAEERTLVFHVGSLVPCGLCKHAVPINSEAEALGKYFFCAEHRRVVSDWYVQCGCKAAQRSVGSEDQDIMQISRPGAAAVWVDFQTAAQQEAEEAEFGRGGYKHCGQLSLRPRGMK